MSVAQEDYELIIFYRDECDTANIYFPKRDILLSEKDSEWYVEQENLDTEERFIFARSIESALEDHNFSKINGVAYVHSMHIEPSEADLAIEQVTKSKVPDIISQLDQM